LPNAGTLIISDTSNSARVFPDGMSTNSSNL
jgi:hypothetical protein